MNLAEKLQVLRNKYGLSQEQLAEKLGVSRQAVSKWESGQSIPDLKKLILISDIYNVTIDALVKDDDGFDILQRDGLKNEYFSRQEAYNQVNVNQLQQEKFNNSIKEENRGGKKSQVVINFYNNSVEYEYKSERELFGLPLVHVNIGRGMKKAKGIVAVGNLSYGIISAGFLSVGVLSFGFLSIGLLSLALFSIGLLLSIGVFSIGIFSIGTIAIGMFSFGALAIGKYAIGAGAIATNIAVGDYAKANIAIGNKLEGVNKITLNTSIDDIRSIIKQEYPNISEWIKKIIEFGIKSISVGTR